MKVDAHQHYWKISRDDYGWITPDLPRLYRNFLEDDLLPDLHACQISKTIVVQAAPTIEETDFILSLSEQSETIAGVVGWLDLDDPSYKKQLERFQQHPKFVGIRVMIQDMEDETTILQQHYVDAFSYFEQIDLPIDLLVTSNQLEAVCQLLKQTSIRAVIDHMAKPEIAQGITEPWKQQMAEIAQYPNIYCKISGMVTEADHQSWRQEDFIPYVHHIVDVFGPNRLMYGSDWPVCLLAASYTDVHDICEATLPTNLTTQQRKNIFGQNAIDFYKVKLSSDGVPHPR